MFTRALVRSYAELELHCVTSGAGMIVTANKFTMPILIAAHERLIVIAKDGYVTAEREDPGLAEATASAPDRIELQNVEFRAARAPRRSIAHPRHGRGC
jgi:hypothetical protein